MMVGVALLLAEVKISRNKKTNIRMKKKTYYRPKQCVQPVV